MIFAGPLFNREEESYIKSNLLQGRVQNQANTFQWNCIDGLLANGIDIKIINALPVGVFPTQYKKLFLRNKEWKYYGKNHLEVGCINLPFIKQTMRALEFKRLILRSSQHKTVLVYSTYYPILKAIKRLPPDYKVVLIVTDLPDYYDSSDNTGSIFSFLRRINNEKIYNCLSRINGFVLLTEEMKTPLKIEGKPYVVVEGICNGEEDSFVSKREVGRNNRINIVYTGTLNRKFGIEVLVNAFKSIIGNNYHLQICGGGDYEKELSLAAKEDTRIEFLGFVSREKAIEIQNQATVLVNPRQNNEEYTKYSFPSKTMEYLQSGIPTIAYKLDGIPREYDELINYPVGNSIECLADLILDVCNDKDGLYSYKAKKAREYVLMNKNNISQTKKIIELFQMI